MHPLAGISKAGKGRGNDENEGEGFLEEASSELTSVAPVFFVSFAPLWFLNVDLACSVLATIR